MTPSSRLRMTKWRTVRIFVLVLIGVGVGAYYYFGVSMPVGSGPAGPAVPRGAFQTVWTDRPVFLLGIGDSVTAGFGASPGYSYFERLADNPADEFPDMGGICLRKVLPNLECRNLSLSGSTSLHHLAMQVQDLEVQDAGTFSLIVITTGGNDLIHNYGMSPPREGAMYGATMEQARPWIDAFAARLDTMLGALKDKFPGGCEIFLANIYDPSDGIGDPESVGLPAWPDLLPILAAYNKVIADCEQRYAFVQVVDIHDAFLGHGVHCTQFWNPHYRWRDPHYWYNVNLEDPNDRGYDAVRRLFLLGIIRAKDKIAMR